MWNPCQRTILKYGTALRCECLSLSKPGLRSSASIFPSVTITWANQLSGRQVIRSRFAPGIKDQAEDEHSKKELMTSLIAWRESLPEVLQYGRTRDPCHTPLQAPLIHVLYK